VAKKKKDAEEVDFGDVPELSDDEMEGIIFQEPETIVTEVETDVETHITGDMSRIVEDEDDRRSYGTVKVQDMPVCPCCKAVWYISEGHMTTPGCGCMIHPVCLKCSRCEAHCEGHRK